MTKSKRKPQPKPRNVIALVVVVVLVALGLSVLFGYQAGRDSVYVPPPLASQAAIAQAEQTIRADYLASSTQPKDCVDPVTNKPYDGTAYFNKYLKVNAYANRATIRACNTNGTLLAKIDGRWTPTEVNLNLSARANPVWAEACEANDILTPDTVVRPENSSIDADNLKLCQALKQGKILGIQDL